MERRDIYGWAVVALGVVLTSIQLLQGVQQLDGIEGGDRAIVFTFETVPFVLVGLTLVVVGYWLRLKPQYEPDLSRIAAWGVGSLVLFGSVGLLLMFSLVVTQGTDLLEEVQYVTMNMLTIGAVVGVLVGIYDAMDQSRRRALERERDRVEQFAQKAADVNNYGRELGRSTSVDQVSSLTIQAIQTFLGITNTAFAVVEDDRTTFVDNTLVGIGDETLDAYARDASEQEPLTVVTEDAHEEFGERATEVLTVLVSDHEEASVVVLLLADDAVDLYDEDYQLLEMLLAHAASALEGISSGEDAPGTLHHRSP